MKPEERKAKPHWTDRTVTKLAMVAVSLLVTVVLLDLVAFFILDKKPARYQPVRFSRVSLMVGHVNRPNLDAYWYRYDDGTKFRVRTNGFGFTDAQRTLEKTRPRIALIGDSTTAFWEMKERSRAQYVIEELTGGRYEVLNFGVRGFGTDQSYVLFKNVGVHFSPDLVIYTFCINDLRNNVAKGGKPFFVIDDTQPDGLALRGYPVGFHSPAGKRGTKKREHPVKITDRLFKNSFSYRKLIGFVKAMTYAPTPLDQHFELRPYKQVYDDEDAHRVELTGRLIRSLNAFARSRGIKLLVVETPYKPALDPEAQAEAVQTYGDVFDWDKAPALLRSECDKDGIPFLSLAEVIRDRGLDVSKLMHRQDMLHLNADGARLYAEAVVEKLESLGWLDPADVANLN